MPAVKKKAPARWWASRSPKNFRRLEPSFLCQALAAREALGERLCDVSPLWEVGLPAWPARFESPLIFDSGQVPIHLETILILVTSSMSAIQQSAKLFLGGRRGGASENRLPKRNISTTQRTARTAQGPALFERASQEEPQNFSPHLHASRSDHLPSTIDRSRMQESFIRNAHGGSRRRSMTPWQREVVQMLAEGKTMREAARILGVVPRTVAFHKYRVMRAPWPPHQCLNINDPQ